MRDLFATDPQRFKRFSLRLGDILLDNSKNRITVETMALWMDLVRKLSPPLLPLPQFTTDLRH